MERSLRYIVQKNSKVQNVQNMFNVKKVGRGIKINVHICLYNLKEMHSIKGFIPLVGCWDWEIEWEIFTFDHSTFLLLNFVSILFIEKSNKIA